jgi:hypothetical protein
LYALPKGRPIKGMKWTNCVAYMIETRITFQSENLKGRYHLENLNVQKSVILKWVLNKSDLMVFTGLSWHGIGSSGGLL